MPMSSDATRAITQTSTPAPPAPRHWQPDEPSSPERRKLGSVEIERRLPVAPGFFCYDLRLGGDVMSGSRPVLRELYAAAEQFEALQALARAAAEAVEEIGRLPIDAERLIDIRQHGREMAFHLSRVRDLGAFGKEEPRG